MTDRSHISNPILAPYATQTPGATSRNHPEPPDPLRSAFELDRHRIIECTAFRRLEQKTQVFAPSQHDHFRTRLTHSLEVSHFARTLARQLRANESLAEAIALAHDLGHPPFGHAGEAALEQAMQDHGGFNHNTHALRVVDFLEHPFPGFRGLNLTYETRAGLLTHDTRYDQPGISDKISSSDFVSTAEQDCATASAGGAISTGASVESQIVSIADRVAYDCHDLEDAIGAALIDFSDLASVKIWQNASRGFGAKQEDQNIHAIRRVVLDNIINDLLSDVVETAKVALESNPTVHEVYSLNLAMVAFSDSMEQKLTELEHFLMERVYRNDAIADMDARGQEMISDLFDAYVNHPARMPQRFVARIEKQGIHGVVCDYIAGMTDRFCRSEYQKLSNRT